MNKKNLIFVLASTLFISPLAFGIDLKNYINQAIDGRNQIVEAIKGLNAGKVEIGKIYSEKLKPKLIDVLQSKVSFIDGQIDSIKGAISPLTNIPAMIKSLIAIGDLEGTLKWLEDNPLTNIKNHLDATKSNFETIAAKLTDGTINAKFDLSITKLQSAVCKIEKTLKALKAQESRPDYKPSPECLITK